MVGYLIGTWQPPVYASVSSVINTPVYSSAASNQDPPKKDSNKKQEKEEEKGSSFSLFSKIATYSTRRVMSEEAFFKVTPMAPDALNDWIAKYNQAHALETYRCHLASGNISYDGNVIQSFEVPGGPVYATGKRVTLQNWVKKFPPVYSEAQLWQLLIQEKILDPSGLICEVTVTPNAPFDETPFQALKNRITAMPLKNEPILTGANFRESLYRLLTNRYKRIRTTTGSWKESLRLFLIFPYTVQESPVETTVSEHDPDWHFPVDLNHIYQFPCGYTRYPLHPYGTGYVSQTGFPELESIELSAQKVNGVGRFTARYQISHVNESGPAPAYVIGFSSAVGIDVLSDQTSRLGFLDLGFGWQAAGSNYQARVEIGPAFQLGAYRSVGYMLGGQIEFALIGPLSLRGEYRLMSQPDFPGKATLWKYSQRSIGLRYNAGPLAATLYHDWLDGNVGSIGRGFRGGISFYF